MKRPLVLGPIAEREVVEVTRCFPYLRDPYRRKLLDRFPYAVIYKVTSQRVYVRAVAHGKRRPGHWDA